ncbi:hypothetical protein NVIE_2756 [Nitrososphaera viennensis EN76]|uniref:Uncharacterized protein n=1 Tax=Nitrososphaera viennensis EN76 TaxID=926571 RepID=A0A060HPB4_9ARCH|nr:hypothetical protein NVIE_2756 [Nitrososphaera viennensis EN76]
MLRNVATEFYGSITILKMENC